MILTIIILSVLLLSSIVGNVLLVWYNRQLVQNLFFVSDNIGDMVGLVKEYHEHLESLYEMEMFYGDSTLKGLIDHTSFILEEMKVFEDIYGLTREDEGGELDDERSQGEGGELDDERSQEEA
jgi:hypothetical protein